MIPVGRLIVNDCGSESYRMAEYMDYYINLLSQIHPSYVKDTYDFVQKLSALVVPASGFLFSVDVDSLYTNIEMKRGLAADNTPLFTQISTWKNGKGLLLPKLHILFTLSR